MYAYLYLAIYISIYLSIDMQLREAKVDTLIFCHGFVQSTFSFFQRKSDMAREVTCKNTGCSYRRLESSSEHLHGSSQLFVSPVLEDLKPSSGLCRPCVHAVQKHTCR